METKEQDAFSSPSGVIVLGFLFGHNSIGNDAGLFQAFIDLLVLKRAGPQHRVVQPSTVEFDARNAEMTASLRLPNR